MACRRTTSGLSTVCVYQLLLCVYVCVCVFVPGVEQRGAGAGRTNEVDRQVSPAVVGQGEPGLDVLQ